MNQQTFDKVVADLEKLVMKKYPTNHEKLVEACMLMNNADPHESVAYPQEVGTLTLTNEMVDRLTYIEGVSDAAKVFAKENGLKYHSRSLLYHF